MSLRRDKLAIIYDMLQAIVEKGGKIKPTHLLYKSNLSYKRMQEYLYDLINSEMADEIEEDGSKFYIIKEKGLKFIAEYRRIKEFTDAFGI